MRILIDTNIFIPLEAASSSLDAEFAELCRLASANGHTILIHPASKRDIERDHQADRKAINLAKLGKYVMLENPPVMSPEEMTRHGITESDENDAVDNEILIAIANNAAHQLITEDRDLHRKAQRLGVSNRVYYLQQAVERLRQLHARTRVALPSIEDIELHRISVSDEFFTTLREDYLPFNDWFAKSAAAGRRAWINRTGAGQLCAICIYKEELDPLIRPGVSLPGLTLKLCTFKVGDAVRGRKIGELFLKAAFRYASTNSLKYIYLTIRAGKHEHLQDLCSDFGFEDMGRDTNNDHVWVKQHPTTPPSETISPVAYLRKYFPHFKCGQGIGKFLVPIQPKYHEILFPDYERSTSHPLLFPVGQATAGNAIKQAYLCHARRKDVQPGDIFLFYRSGDERALTSVGVVESTCLLDNADDISTLVAKRTVYSYEDLQRLATKQTKVILFRLVAHFANPVSSVWLLNKAIVRGNIQTIRRIRDESFQQIVEEGQLSVHCLHTD